MKWVLIAAAAGSLACRGSTEDAGEQRTSLPAPPMRPSDEACNFEGDPNGTPVLITGFERFPTDSEHENVSEVAVRALRPSALGGIRVMRMILPVEYDHAAERAVEQISRCRPAFVIGLGQGGATIDLERAAYNLKNGAMADNRGSIVHDEPILVGGPAQRETMLPLTAIDTALRAIGESPVMSNDPGRYICNNVFYVVVGAAAAQGARAGFIHLPLTTTFSPAERARWGRVAEVIVEAATR